MKYSEGKYLKQIDHLALVYLSECGHKPTHIFLSEKDFAEFMGEMRDTLEWMSYLGIIKNPLSEALDKLNQRESIELNMSIGKVWVHKSNIEDGRVGMGIEFTLGGEKK